MFFTSICPRKFPSWKKPGRRTTRQVWNFWRRIGLVTFTMAGGVGYGLSTGEFATSLFISLTFLAAVLGLDWIVSNVSSLLLVGAGGGAIVGGFLARVVGWTITGGSVFGTGIPGSLVGLVMVYIGGLLGVQTVRELTDSTGPDPVTGTEPKVLDTSVIIDGRIEEIVELGFLEGPFYVPPFVVQELQSLADSENRLTRNRGRRGLDVLESLKEQDSDEVRFRDWDLPEDKPVDERLVEVAEKLGGTIVTNDYNLNKVAGLQHVPVLNLNDLSNAMKSVYIPGESLSLEIVKPGEKPEQGIGYLEDGTMIVVEDGRDKIGEETKVTVTSLIETSAGRMIFAEKSDD